MNYDLIDCNAEVLKNPLPRFDFNKPPMDPIELAHILAESMLKNNGMGLAANQIGLPHRVFAIKANPIIVCFNPLIVDESEDKIYLDEGCLSYPGFMVKVKRSKTIKIRYTEPNGNVVTKTFDGLTARIAQHEYDHLQGINFTKRANKIHLEQARNRLKSGKPLKSKNDMVTAYLSGVI
jgi:peptide deformylase